MLPTTIQNRGLLNDPFRWADREFDRMLRNWAGDGGQLQQLTAAYPVDIREDEKNVYVEAEMPGFKKDEINVTVEEGILHITAERSEQPDQQEEQGYHLRERRYSRFHRAFTLPTAVDESKADAKLDEGVLHLTLPKTAEVQPRKIEVK